MKRTYWIPWAILDVVVLLLLTYLLVQSRTPDPTMRTQVHEALHAFGLHDTELNRDVLLARAGLLPHYDSLSTTMAQLEHALTILRDWRTAAMGDTEDTVQPHLEALAEAMQQKEILLDYFKSDNALLRNSLMYFTHAGQLSVSRPQGLETAIMADLGTLSHAMLRFVQMPLPEVGEQIVTVLDRLPAVSPRYIDLYTLGAHGQLIVRVLPQVDELLRQIMDVPTTRRLEALRAALLQYYSRVDTRAQFFRFLLFAVALGLLGYLIYVYTRLHANARALRRANDSLHHEITERQQAEDALRDSEVRLRAITDTARDGIIAADSDGHVVFWNNAAQDMFGFDAAEAIGTPYARLLPELGVTEPQPESERFHESAAAPAGGQIIERVGKHKNGQTFPLEMSVSSWTTPQGTYLTGIIRDISERKRLEATTRQQELQLIQASKMTALGTLVAGVAHEINNPNHLVLMNAQVLSASWADASSILDEYARDHGTFLLGGLPYTEMRDTLPTLIHDMYDAGLRIERIVNDLKDFARPHDQMDHTTLHLNDAVQRALALLKYRIRKATKHFQVELSPDLPPLRGDAHHLEQVVINLVLNALEALPDPDHRVTVGTRYNEHTSSLELAVQDEGVGIAPENLERLCDPFFTTKQDQGGTGLGLAITYMLVRDHGGTLNFTSTPGVGTRALVTFSCRTPSETPLGMQTAAT